MNMGKDFSSIYLTEDLGGLAGGKSQESLGNLPKDRLPEVFLSWSILSPKNESVKYYQAPRKASESYKLTLSLVWEQHFPMWPQFPCECIKKHLIFSLLKEFLAVRMGMIISKLLHAGLVECYMRELFTNSTHKNLKMLLIHRLPSLEIHEKKQQIIQAGEKAYFLVRMLFSKNNFYLIWQKLW